MGAIFSSLLFMVVFGIALKFSHFRSDDAEERKKTVINQYPDGIEDRDAPFPLIMTLIIAGTIAWVFFYILGTGLLEVVI